MGTISAIYRGRGLRGALQYVLSPKRLPGDKKGPERAHVLACDGVSGETLEELVAGFRPYRQVLGKGQDVVHVSFSWRDEDMKLLPPSRREEYLDEWHRRMGLGDAPRTYVLHTDTNHVHIHSVGLNIDAGGRRVRTSWDRSRSAKVCEALDREFGLSPENRPGKSLRDLARKGGQVGPDRSQNLGVIDSMKATLRLCVEIAKHRGGTIYDLERELNARGFDLVVTPRPGGGVQGVSLKDRETGKVEKASTLDRGLSYNNLIKKHRLGGFDEARPVPKGSQARPADPGPQPKPGTPPSLLVPDRKRTRSRPKQGPGGLGWVAEWGLRAGREVLAWVGRGARSLGLVAPGLRDLAGERAGRGPGRPADLAPAGPERQLVSSPDPLAVQDPSTLGGGPDLVEPATSPGIRSGGLPGPDRMEGGSTGPEAHGGDGSVPAGGAPGTPDALGTLERGSAGSPAAPGSHAEGDVPDLPVMPQPLAPPVVFDQATHHPGAVHTAAGEESAPIELDLDEPPPAPSPVRQAPPIPTNHQVARPPEKPSQSYTPPEPDGPSRRR